MVGVVWLGGGAIIMEVYVSNSLAVGTIVTIKDASNPFGFKVGVKYEVISSSYDHMVFLSDEGDEIKLDRKPISERN